MYSFGKVYPLGYSLWERFNQGVMWGVARVIKSVRTRWEWEKLLSKKHSKV